MTKIGLVLFDNKGDKALDAYPDGVEFYTYHQDFGDEVSVLFSPQHTSQVVRYGPPFDWLVELLQKKTEGEGLAVVWLPPRKNSEQELAQLVEAGLISHRTVIRKGKGYYDNRRD
jgi:hypothetical protein